MSEIQNQAVEKIKAERTGIKGKKEAVIAKPTADALISFCEQSEDFSRSVVWGGSFEECIKSVAGGIGSAVSDFEVYQKAAQHYLPGAKIKFEMKIITAEESNQEKEPETFSFDLSDLI